MNSEKIVMGEAPEKGSKSKKGVLFVIFAALIVILILMLIIKPFSSKEPESKLVEKQAIQETPSVPSSEGPAGIQPIVSDTTKPVQVVERPSTPTPPIVSTTKPLTHVVQKGDCLWNIASSEFGDPFKWTKIYEENKDKIINPDLIYPSQELKLPKNNK